MPFIHQNFCPTIWSIFTVFPDAWPLKRAVRNSDNFSIARTMRAIIRSFRFFFRVRTFSSLFSSASNSICLNDVSISKHLIKPSEPCFYNGDEVLKHFLKTLLCKSASWLPHLDIVDAKFCKGPRVSSVTWMYWMTTLVRSLTFWSRTPRRKWDWANLLATSATTNWNRQWLRIDHWSGSHNNHTCTHCMFRIYLGQRLISNGFWYKQTFYNNFQHSRGKDIFPPKYPSFGLIHYQ